MAADYQLTDSPDVVVRKSDGARIPRNVLNTDWRAYQASVAAGNAPDPYVTPIVKQSDQVDLVQFKVAFNHENRLRALESKAPITAAQFRTALDNL